MPPLKDRLWTNKIAANPSGSCPFFASKLATILIFEGEGLDCCCTEA
jgi:hypothetical protein